VAYIPNPLIIPVGVVMGILLAMPFGPINLLGLQRALERGFFGGMAAAIGIMAADGTIALGAALGVNAISGAIREYRTAIQLVGGAALLAFGVNLYVTKATIIADAQADKASLRDYVWDIPQMFFLTLSNPTALLGLVAIFGGVSSFVEVESYVDAFTMVAAILGGSFLYWFVVTQFIAANRHRLDVVRLGQINRIAGLILIGFGCVLIGEMVMKRFRFW
jgi:threonine/homoserine/homoserine lactone efflux protein